MNWEDCHAVESIPDKMGGAVVFVGTRIPVSTLFENFKAGATIDEFLDWFPGSDRGQIEAVLNFLAGSEPQCAA